MQKSGLLLVVSGALIVIGLILLVLGNQVILEGINQGSGQLSSNQVLTVLGEFDTENTSTGIFAVQIIEFKEGTFSAKIINPSDIEIVYEPIKEDTIEREFDALEDGTYKLIVESTSIEETQVFGAIGPLPDVGKKTIVDVVSISILIMGMVGLVLAGVVEIRNRRKSV